MGSFAWRIGARLVVVVNGPQPPSDEAWTAYVNEMARLERPERVRALIFSAGGGPSGAQRERLEAAIGTSAMKVAVLTDSLVARTIGMMARWLNPNLRILPTKGIGAAGRYLDLRPAELEHAVNLLGELAAEVRVPLPPALRHREVAVGAPPPA